VILRKTRCRSRALNSLLSNGDKIGMWQFIFTNLLMISLGTILYLVVRSLPRIEEEETKKPNLLERWILSDIPAKLDRSINAYAGKLFRKLKVYVMRLDNFLTEKLKKMNSGESGGLTGQAKPKIDFKEISGGNGRENGEKEEEKISLL
jgi:hypothetical protein